MSFDPRSASSTPGTTDNLTPIAGFASESERASRRRTRLGIERPAPWALAFSGGGIRSATFCLGVLQGLAKCAPPPLNGNDQPTAPKSSRDSLLPQFDYLSTVSGGGYIGSFFCSLFVPKRLNTADTLTDEQTAEQAYKVFEEEPPGRLRSSVTFDAQTPGEAPLAWLRENGRYMAPTGTGDMVYAMALAIRNWFAMHYVLGTVLLTAFSLLGLARAGLVQWSFHNPFIGIYGVHEAALLNAVLSESTFIWWSPVWWLALPVVALWLIPCALAFWLTHPRPGGTVGDRPVWLSAAAVCGLLVGAVLCAPAVWAWYGSEEDWMRVVAASGITGAVT
ncbi:MAG TPA: hypothetical protein VJA26_18050, partial [Gammaproteobacteria bacterium]|nr:hypothetical protein [Gammaproteobacteria bacterium]